MLSLGLEVFFNLLPPPFLPEAAEPTSELPQPSICPSVTVCHSK